MNLRPKTCQNAGRSRTIIVAAVLAICHCAMASEHRDKGYMYLSPVPGAEYTSAQTQYVLVRFTEVSPYDITNLSSFIMVMGDSSGNHPGQTKIASDDRTVIFEMSTNFAANEAVTVTLTPTVDAGAGGTVEPYQYQFYVTRPATSSAMQSVSIKSTSTPEPAADTPVTLEAVPVLAAIGDGPMIMPNGVSVPSNFPHINITINDNPDPSYIFLDNRSGGANSYNVIFDNQGSPIWYLQANDERRDMKVQQNGVLTMLNRTNGHFFQGLNTNYEEIATYRAVNGYSTDEHELVVLPNGHYLLIGLRHNNVDMTQYLPGANTNASVGETIIQEFTPEGDLIFQWRAWDNYDVADVHLDNPYNSGFRFPHMNAIDIDEDGHVLVSCRHISEVTKINRDTGDIIWRLSGIPKNNDFTYVNDNFSPPGPRNQHAIRHTGNGRYLLFDNGDLHSPQVSRGVEYELDLDAMTAIVVWQYPETPTTSMYSHYMGNTQRLPNGNTLINWAIGSLPKLTEVRPNGTRAFEMNWANGNEAYRVWKHAWQGIALRPNLIIEPQPDNVTLLFNKFGDPDVNHYRIYAGTSPHPTTLMATSTTTLIPLTDFDNEQRYYFRVTAVNSQGVESGYSEEKNIVVNIIKTDQDQNMVINGDFSQAKTAWTWNVAGSADAQWLIEEDASHFAITAPGSMIWDIQLTQGGMKLTQGIEYVLQFDARADQPRYIEAIVGLNQSPWTNYSQILPPQITPVQKHFQHIFTMQDPSDYDARIVLNMGGSIADVYLDNISLMAVVPGDIDYDGCVRLDDLAVLAVEWLQVQSGLASDLDGSGGVDLKDFAIYADNLMQSCP